MKNILIIIALLGLAFYGYQKFQVKSVATDIVIDDIKPTYSESLPASSTIVTTPSTSSYHCDGRTHCSQMKSCEEATYFSNNCPNTQMDGNNDGVPCESQWCQ